MSKRKQTRVKKNVQVKRDTGNKSLDYQLYRRYARIDVYNYLVDERPTRANINNKIKEYKSFIKNDKILLGSTREREIYTTEVIKELQYYYNNYDKVPFKRR